MDPPALINGIGGGGGGGAFPIPIPSGAPLPEIWPFQLNISHPPRCRNGRISDDGLFSLDHRVRKRRDLDGDYAKAGAADSASNAHGDALVTNDSEGKRLKTSGINSQGQGKGNKADEADSSSGKAAAKSNEPPKQDYIHVRARRGQATDSHSLAERARREKISERMKILQDLVPVCTKVIGKALVLDEIINYIQSLQNQVEFLSMKIEAVNSRLTPGLEVAPSKYFGQQSFDAREIPFVSEAPKDYSRGSSPDWLHMQIGGSFNGRT